MVVFSMPGAQSLETFDWNKAATGTIAGFREAFEPSNMRTIFGCCVSEDEIRRMKEAQHAVSEDADHPVSNGVSSGVADKSGAATISSCETYAAGGSSASVSTTATSPNPQEPQQDAGGPSAASAPAAAAAPGAEAEATSRVQPSSTAAQTARVSSKGAAVPSVGSASTCDDSSGRSETRPQAGREKYSELSPSVPNATGISSSAPSYTKTLPRTASMDSVKSLASTSDDRMKPVTSSDLMATTQRIASSVVIWNPDSFTRVKLLQDAIRNHGRVDLMLRKDSKGGQKVAVKRMPTTWVTAGPSQFKEAYPRSSELPWTDIGIVGHLNSIKYPYVCDLIGVYRDHQNTYVVNSLATEGDLFGWCEDEPLPGPQREAKMLPLAKQIFAAVRWLHNIGIAHRDLSLENILLTDIGGGEMRIKLIDFGMATLSKTCTNETRGKASYQAPEMHGDDPCDPLALDHFALGVVLFAMAAQDYPWTSTTPKSCRLFEYVKMFGLRKFLTHRRVRKGPTQHLSDVFSADFVDLIEMMLAFDPAKRATLDEMCYASGPKAKRSIKDAKWFKRRQ